MIQQITHYSQKTLRQMAGMLARAFHNDPLFQLAMPDEQHRTRTLPALLKLNLQYGLRFGDVYASAQNGLAIWLRPGENAITIPRALQAGMLLTPLKIGLSAVLRLGRLNSISELIHEQLAPEPHWYLFLLGVDPVSQGRGLGGLLLQPVLASADAVHQPCYLETNNPSAVRFYQKLGFVIAAERQPTLSNPCLWAMRRESR